MCEMKWNQNYRCFTTEDTKWNVLTKTSQQLVYLPVYILYMLLLLHGSNNFFCVLNFYIGIKLRVLKFQEDLNSRIFNFPEHFTIAKNAKLDTREIKYQ